MHWSFEELLAASKAMEKNALEVEDAAIDQLQKGAASNYLVCSLQRASVQKEVIALGFINRCEFLLQSHFPEQKHIFTHLERVFEDKKQADLSKSVRAIRLLNNVLKHGEGRSLDELRKENGLWFAVKSEGEHFFDEGDVSEVESIVDTRGVFLEILFNKMKSVFDSIEEE
ncbi:hypothetical protein SAMN05444851_2276 [Aliiroseovarius sediminilitoris]|uniref:HEPN domain-containing protein n=1 Tax=Aliiroseovarius sediminilitoris TaxID=1173584 RepID=A0A1I0Q6H6_9RHOB|nr:hypothetical protein [Aliiroseovarius sediminilitoris]SEW22540.1 hypothetical protein SAMN05444851_2276 [Aliiroseovarius sediminilitoris]